MPSSSYGQAMAPIRAGCLRHRITIQSPPTPLDGFGRAIGAYATVATVWACVEEVSGSENYRGDQFAPEITHRVIIRARAGLQPTMRIKYTDGFAQQRFLDVQYKGDPDGRRRYFILDCIERVGQS